MNNEAVQLLVQQLSIQHFQKPFQHRAYFNPRLRTTGGRYLLESHNIELNRKSYDLYGEQELIGIILHELCHYHLHIEGKGYRHQDVDFKKRLQEVGAPRFCSSIMQASTKSHPKKTYMYRCISCNLQYKRDRKMNLNKYVCGKCRGKLIEIT